MKKTYTLLLFCIISFSFPLFAQNFQSNEEMRFFAKKTNGQITLDGKLTEDVWQGESITGFTQRDPDQGKPATEKSKVWISYDANNLYVAAKLYDSDVDVIDKNMARRDSWFESDWFLFFIDPYFDKRTGYYFAVNAGGTMNDGTLFNDSWDDSAWDCVWEAQTSINGDGWIVEMRIPFSQIRFHEAEKMKWGFNVKREIKKNKEESYLIMVPKEESGFVSKFATLEGLDGIKPKQRFEVIPYFVQKAQYLRHDELDPFYKSNQYKTTIGADIKIGLGSNYSIDATINPDFGQVEVDPAVVNLSAFETYYNEKRPFFVNGSEIFNFGFGGVNNNWGFNFGQPNLFYSRRIGRSPQGDVDTDGYVRRPGETNIIGAAKLTGKIDETWSIGVLTAVTERTFADVWENDQQFEKEIEPLSNYTAIRSQKQFDDGRYGIGGMFTSVNRDLSDETLENNMRAGAYVFGMDSWFTLDDDDEYVVSANMIGSYTFGSKESMIALQEQPYRYLQRPDMEYMPLDSNRTSLSGVFSRVMLNKQKGNFYINSAIGLISPGFEYNDLGFQFWSNKINAHTVLGYRWYEPDGIFRRKTVYLAYARDWDFEGNNRMNRFFMASFFQFENYYSIDIFGGYNFESLTPSLLRGGPMVLHPKYQYVELYASSDSRKELVFELGYEYWHSDIGTFGNKFEMEFTWKPTPNIRLEFEPSYVRELDHTQYIDTFDDPHSTQMYGKRYVFGDIVQETVAASIRLDYSFTPQLTLQVYVQPLFANGTYTNFKEIMKPRTMDLFEYGREGSTVSYNAETDEYTVDPDGDGPSETFTFENPNFNFKSLRANAVLRWEVNPGSVLYLVWTHDKVNTRNPGNFEFGRDFDHLIHSEPNNIFMAKFSYWFDL